MNYVIRAKDPGGEFLKAPWATPSLPRVGEQVMLPADPRGEGWQELTVEEVIHYRDRVEVWLGGTTGWESGSVAELFTNAEAYIGTQS